MAKTNYLLWGGVALAAYLLYTQVKGPAAAVPAAPAGTITDPVTEYPTVNTPISSTAAAPPTTGITIPPGIDPDVYGVVTNWIQMDQDPRMQALWQSNVPSEFNTLYNIIENNLWGSPSVAPAWNALIAKYQAYA
jgi:hypothetical protein